MTKLNFNIQEVVDIIGKINRQDPIANMNSWSAQIATEIALPWSMMTAFFIANKFGVPFGVAMHQAFCPGLHDGCF